MPRLLEHQSTNGRWFEYLSPSDDSQDSWDETPTHVVFDSPPASPDVAMGEVSSESPTGNEDGGSSQSLLEVGNNGGPHSPIVVDDEPIIVTNDDAIDDEVPTLDTSPIVIDDDWTDGDVLHPIIIPDDDDDDDDDDEDDNDNDVLHPIIIPDDDDEDDNVMDIDSAISQANNLPVLHASTISLQNGQLFFENHFEHGNSLKPVNIVRPAVRR